MTNISAIFLFLYFYKVIWYNLDNGILKLPKKWWKMKKHFCFFPKNEKNNEPLKKWKK